MIGPLLALIGLLMLACGALWGVFTAPWPQWGQMVLAGLLLVILGSVMGALLGDYD